MNFSKKVLISCVKELLISKEGSLKQELAAIREAAANETKSSMGDKYETSREMMRQEESKLADQLRITEDQRVSLERINPDRISEEVEVGALVETETANYFVSIGFGKVLVKDEIVFFISPVAPLAKLFLGKKMGEVIEFNGLKHLIKHVQ